MNRAVARAKTTPSAVPVHETCSFRPSRCSSHAELERNAHRTGRLVPDCEFPGKGHLAEHREEPADRLVDARSDDASMAAAWCPLPATLECHPTDSLVALAADEETDAERIGGARDRRVTEHVDERPVGDFAEQPTVLDRIDKSRARCHLVAHSPARFQF